PRLIYQHGQSRAGVHAAAWHSGDHHDQAGWWRTGYYPDWGVAGSTQSERYGKPDRSCRPTVPNTVCHSDADVSGRLAHSPKNGASALLSWFNWQLGGCWTSSS